MLYNILHILKPIPKADTYSLTNSPTRNISVNQSQPKYIFANQFQNQKNIRRPIPKPNTYSQTNSRTKYIFALNLSNTFLQTTSLPFHQIHFLNHFPNPSHSPKLVYSAYSNFFSNTNSRPRLNHTSWTSLNISWTCLNISWTSLNISWTCLNISWTSLNISWTSLNISWTSLNISWTSLDISVYAPDLKSYKEN